MSTPYFEPSKEWEGETCFILGGGPSASNLDLERLRGHKLIVINSSCYVAPWADFLVFADTRWWDDNVKKVTEGKQNGVVFQNRIVSVSSLCRHPRLLRMKRKLPPGFSKDRNFLAIRYTTLISAMNLAIHLGVKKIVLVGADGKLSEDGKRHHHEKDHPHPWKHKPNSFEKQRREFKWAAKELKEMGIECVNASPGSALADIWPIVDFGRMLEEDDARHEIRASLSSTLTAQSLQMAVV